MMHIFIKDLIGSGKRNALTKCENWPQSDLTSRVFTHWTQHALTERGVHTLDTTCPHQTPSGCSHTGHNMPSPNTERGVHTLDTTCPHRMGCSHTGHNMPSLNGVFTHWTQHALTERGVHTLDTTCPHWTPSGCSHWTQHALTEHRAGVHTLDTTCPHRTGVHTLDTTCPHRTPQVKHKTCTGYATEPHRFSFRFKHGHVWRWTLLHISSLRLEPHTALLSTLRSLETVTFKSGVSGYKLW